MTDTVLIPDSGTVLKSRTRRIHAWFIGTAALCSLAFGWMVTLGTGRFIAEDSFGSFYDYQAKAWLDGRWDVPEPVLSGEAFVADGKVYGYFGPTPALMRLPLTVLGIGIGKVTRVYMLFDYMLCLVGIYALLWLATRWREANAIPMVGSVVLLVAGAGLGSTLFFLGSRAYVYHEAILCGAAFAIGSTYCGLRYLQMPGTCWWLAALICGVLAIHARAPIGLFALTVLGGAAITAIVRNSKGRFNANGRRHWLVGMLALGGILSFNAVSFLKFGTFEGCPLRLNVQYTPEKLALLENRNFHLSNLRFNADSYLLRPTFSVSPRFPYVYREFADRTKYPESRIAYRDPTLAMPWSMPGLFALAIAGGLLAFVTVPAFRFPLMVLSGAAIPAAVAMLTAVAVTQRYESDFCPVLLAAAAFGVTSLEALSSWLRRFTAFVTGALMGLGILVTFALTLHHQREVVWGVPDEARRCYQQFRARVDGWWGVEQRR